MSSSNENIVVETVKIPEDGDGLLLRVYNSSDAPQSGEVRVAGHRAAAFTGVMEEMIAPAGELIELCGFELKIIRFAGQKDIDTPA